MNHAAPHFLLLSEAGPPSGDRADSQTDARHWRFVLEATDGSTFVEAEDDEPFDDPQRIELLSVVRGLEALDQPSRVTLVTTSQYVSQGLRFGLEEWRENDWQWDRFGERVPIKNADLWRRVDQALRYHQVECRMWRIDRSHDTDPRKARVPRPLAPHFAHSSPPAQERQVHQGQTATRPASGGLAGQGQTAYGHDDRRAGRERTAGAHGGDQAGRAGQEQTASGEAVQGQTATPPVSSGLAGQGQTAYLQDDRRAGLGQAAGAHGSDGGGQAGRAGQGQTASGEALPGQTATRPVSGGPPGQGQTAYRQDDRRAGLEQAAGPHGGDGGGLAGRAGQEQTASGEALPGQTATRPVSSGPPGPGQTAYGHDDRRAGLGQAAGGHVGGPMGPAGQEQTATRYSAVDSLATARSATSPPLPFPAYATAIRHESPLASPTDIPTTSVRTSDSRTTDSSKFDSPTPDVPANEVAETHEDGADDAPRNILRPHFLRIQDQLTPRRPRKKWRFASDAEPSVRFGQAAGRSHLADERDHVGLAASRPSSTATTTTTVKSAEAARPRLRTAVFFEDDDLSSTSDASPVAVAQQAAAGKQSTHSDQAAPTEQTSLSRATWFKGLRRRVADWAQLLCDKIETQ